MAAKQIRKRILIADFIDKKHASGRAYANGWFFAIHEAFKDAIDIKLTEVVITKLNPDGTKTKQKTKVWTQGKAFSFSEGDTIFDTPDGYLAVDQDRDKAHLFIQVIQAAPVEDENNGFVRFQVFRQENTPFRIIRGEVYCCSQAEFVRLMKTGFFTELGKESDTDFRFIQQIDATKNQR